MNKRYKDLNLNETANLCKSDYSFIHVLSNLKSIRQKIIRILERARFGVSRYDSWDLDSYLLRVIENGLKLLKDAGNSHPCWCTFEEWQNKLDNMIQLAEVATTDSFDETLDAFDEMLDTEAKYGHDSEEAKQARKKWLQEEEKADNLISNSTTELLTELNKYFFDLWD